MNQSLDNGMNPSNFEIYVTGGRVLLVCIPCDTNLIETDGEGALLLDLTDAAKTHVCDPRKVKAVEELLQQHESEIRAQG